MTTSAFSIGGFLGNSAGWIQQYLNQLQMYTMSSGTIANVAVATPSPSKPPTNVEWLRKRVDEVRARL